MSGYSTLVLGIYFDAKYHIRSIPRIWWENILRSIRYPHHVHRRDYWGIGWETTAVLVQYLRIRLMLECNMHDTLSEGKHKRMYYMVYRIIGILYHLILRMNVVSHTMDSWRSLIRYLIWCDTCYPKVLQATRKRPDYIDIWRDVSTSI